MRRGTPAAYEFGRFVKELRTEASLTCAEASARMGKTAPYVSQIELGVRALKEEKVHEYAKMLDVNPAWLMAIWRDTQKEPDPPIVRARKSSIPKGDLESAIQDLNAPERERVLGYIHALKESRRLSDVKPL